MFPCPELDLNLDVQSYASKIRTDLLKCYETVAKNSGSKVSKFKFYADRNVRAAQYVIGDRVYLLKQSKKKGVSKKLSHKWKGPYTITEVRGEHNYLIRPDSGGKKQLVHANRLKKCFRPAVNTRYQSFLEESEVNPCENRDEVRLDKDLELAVADTVEPFHEKQVEIDHEYCSTEKVLDAGQNGAETVEMESFVEKSNTDVDFEPNYYLEKQIESAQRADLLAGEEASHRGSQRNRKGPDRLTYF